MENFEDKFEAINEVGYQADELERISRDLEKRLWSDDVPPRLADDINVELGEQLEEVVDALKDIAQYLKKTIPEVEENLEMGGDDL